MELDFTVAVHKVDSGVDIYKYMQLFKLQLKKLFPKYSEDLLSSSQCRIGRGENVALLQCMPFVFFFT